MIEVRQEFIDKANKYSKEELVQILGALCHNFGGIFHYLDERGRSLPLPEDEEFNDFLLMKPLALMLKSGKFQEFFVQTMPEEYSANHVGEEAHCINRLGEDVEKATDFKFIRDGIL